MTTKARRRQTEPDHSEVSTGAPKGSSRHVIGSDAVPDPNRTRCNSADSRIGIGKQLTQPRHEGTYVESTDQLNGSGALSSWTLPQSPLDDLSRER